MVFSTLGCPLLAGFRPPLIVRVVLGMEAMRPTSSRPGAASAGATSTTLGPVPDHRTESVVDSRAAPEVGNAPSRRAVHERREGCAGGIVRLRRRVAE